MREIWNKIKNQVVKAYIGEIGTFIIGWIILFDLVGNTAIPLVYGNDCGWFAVPNLIIDFYVICKFIKRVNE